MAHSNAHVTLHVEVDLGYARTLTRMLDNPALLDEIVALHQPVYGSFSCDAYTVQPVYLRHQFSNHSSARRLRCTLPSGHRGDHKDGACCWRAHWFSESVAAHPAYLDRSDWRRCAHEPFKVGGVGYVNCSTAALLRNAGLLPPAGRY